jgi:hypothetical protein
MIGDTRRTINPTIEALAKGERQSRQKAYFNAPNL